MEDGGSRLTGDLDLSGRRPVVLEEMACAVAR
jgi:hypothetical protein